MLGLPYDAVETIDPDTALVPDSGPTVASRTVAVVGRIVADAARELDRALAARLGRPAGQAWTGRELARAAAAPSRGGRRRAASRRASRTPPGSVFDDKLYRGDAYAAYAWAATAVEVEVDLVTFEVKVAAAW